MRIMMHNIEVKSEKKKENENINNKENKKNDGLGDAELKKKIEALLPNLGTGYEFSEKEKELLRSYSGKGGSPTKSATTCTDWLADMAIRRATCWSHLAPPR